MKFSQLKCVLGRGSALTAELMLADAKRIKCCCSWSDAASWVACCCLSATFDQRRCAQIMVSDMRPLVFFSVWGYWYSSVTQLCARLGLYRLIQSTHCQFNWICVSVASLHTHTDFFTQTLCSTFYVSEKRAADFAVKCTAKKEGKSQNLPQCNQSLLFYVFKVLSQIRHSVSQLVGFLFGGICFVI